MASQIEGVVDGAVDGNEALSLTLGFETLHLSFPSSDRQVGVFHPVIVPQFGPDGEDGRTSIS